jgi:DNA-binding XRE family transcriptional regulator
MTNHPNRTPGNPAGNPAPADIRAAREAAEMTQTAAGAVIYASLRAWQQWESGERRMHPAMWELWQLKVTRANGDTVAALPDAHLTATAPKLLEALRALLVYINVAIDRSEGDTFGVHHNDATDAIIAAEAIITRANGELV